HPLCLLTVYFCLSSCLSAPRSLHSFPTRRSSDLFYSLKGATVAQHDQQVPQRAWWIALIPLAIAYVADLWSKEAVLANMQEGERIPVLEPILTWHFIRNPGAAFSIGIEYTWVFSIIQAVGLIIVLYLIFRKARTLPWLLTLGALGGGIAGNLTDRLFREPGFGTGHVI